MKYFPVQNDVLRSNSFAKQILTEHVLHGRSFFPPKLMHGVRKTQLCAGARRRRSDAGRENMSWKSEAASNGLRVTSHSGWGTVTHVPGEPPTELWGTSIFFFSRSSI